jgi:hypothetical protein
MCKVFRGEFGRGEGGTAKFSSNRLWYELKNFNKVERGKKEK